MKRALFISTLFFFFFFAAFGMNLCADMSKDMQGTREPTHVDSMNNSPSSCQMNIVAHLTRWQQTLGTTFNHIGWTLALMTVVFIALVFRLTQLTNAPPQVRIFKQYSEDHPDTRLFNPLLLAISKGILQPRLYA